jgi:DNA-3-methyladenine glycosylase I
VPPKTKKPESLADYLDAMTAATFRAGLSWTVVEAKWEGTRQAFNGFDPEKVAAYKPADVDRLMVDPRVIHNKRKLQAAVGNAGVLLETDREFGGFQKYLASFDDNDELVRDLHRRFAFLGESVAHFFLWAIGWNLPAQNAWGEKHFAGRDRSHWTHH